MKILINIASMCVSEERVWYPLAVKRWSWQNYWPVTAGCPHIKMQQEEKLQCDAQKEKKTAQQWLTDWARRDFTNLYTATYMCAHLSSACKPIYPGPSSITSAIIPIPLLIGYLLVVLQQVDLARNMNTWQVSVTLLGDGCPLLLLLVLLFSS